MKTFRHLLKGPIGRIVTAVVVLSTVHLAAEPRNYLMVLEQQQQKEAQIREIARKMNVDPEFLLNAGQRRAFDFRGLFDWVANTLGLRSSSTNLAANAQPESVRESIAKVKERYALVAADTTLAKLAQLIELSAAPASEKAKKKGQIKAELRSMLRLLDKDLLPPVKDGLPGLAQSRDRDMREAIKDLRKDVKAVLNGHGALDDANLDATLAKLRDAAGGQFTLRNKGPRWTRDPFPVKDTYRFAPVATAPPSYDEESGAPALAPASAIVATNAKPATRLAANAVPSEVAALAATLQTPAKIFTYVHDRVDWESYSGVAKGSLGTLKEAKGNDWDQALLLHDLLVAAGYDAQLEWGRVTLPIAKAMNLVGTEDPLQAANLLATAGFDGILLTSKGAPIAVQMSHVWVRAFIPYIPNRGAKAGTPDTWVRMDPSFKRYEYQPGIAINGQIPWNQDEYLNNAAATLQQPSQFYGDKIWSYIRAKNIDCVNLSQVAKLGRVRTANFPFVPSTLTTKIDEVRGTAAAPPAEQVQNVTIEIVTDNGAMVGSFNAAIGDLWGKKLSLTFPPATPDDAAVIASYGGLFNTPSYLVRLKPVFSVDDQPVAEGFAVSAGAALDMNLTFRQPNVADDFTHHQVVAGETHTLVFDAGTFPDDLVQSRIERLKALTAANAPEDSIRSEQLYLVGLRYMQHVDDGIAFATGVRWQRAVKRVFEANVRRQIDITYNVAGAPVRLKPAENNIDVSRLLVGIVPINNDPSNRAEALALAGLQSSYLEGAIWEEMNSVQGISAAKALLLSKQQGQQLHTVDASNVDAKLALVNLAPDVEAEIRGAVAQGRVAKIPSANITLGGWTGTGYILQDPRTGAATYPISGGLAGGSAVGDLVAAVQTILGSETWVGSSGLAAGVDVLMMLLGDPMRTTGTPSTIQSDPVNMSNGNMFRTTTDFSIQSRGFPVMVSRTYNSRSTFNGPFGYGWTWNYGAMLVANGDGSITYREADGTEHEFTASAGGWIAPPGKHVELVRNGSGWTMTFRDGMRSEFDARGLLTSVEDLNGNTVTINRDAAGAPTTVADDTGRQVLSFTITAGKITSITDLVGRVARYEYDGEDLVAVTDTAGKRWTFTYDLAHNMTSLADPVGNTQSYSYDADDRLLQHIDAVGAEELFHYDLGARQSVVTDRRGGDRYIQFDDRGRATLEADPTGNVVRAAFDANNNRTSTTDSRGKVNLYEFDAKGNVVRHEAPDGGVTVATYDTHSRPLTTTGPSGSVISNTYDSRGNLTQSSRTVNGVTHVTVNTYDAHGQVATTTSPTGETSTMTWTSIGTLATQTDGQNKTTTMTVDPLGRITSIADAEGNANTIAYDDKDRVLSTTDQGLQTAIEYDAAGRRKAVSTPRGTTVYTLDGEGRVLSVRDPLGNVTRTSYNEAGDVVSSTDARGNVTRYEYDSAGRVTKMIDANGGTWLYGYCGAIGGGSSCSACGSGGGGSYCELTDPNGKTMKREFDDMGRITLVIDSLGNRMATRYDQAGRKILETDANGNSTAYEYDDGGRLMAVTEANNAVTRYTYDKNGNKLTQQDPNGNTWSFKYDLQNRLIEESDPLGRKTAYVYDSRGRVLSKTDAKGQVTTYEYAGNRIVKANYPGNVTETFTYDVLGRRVTAANQHATTTYGYDSLNRVTSVRRQTGQIDVTVRYDYDAAGNRIRMTTPHSATPVSYIYDAKNRLTQIDDPTLGMFRFEYDAMDRRTSLQHPNGVTTSYTYDGAYRLAAMSTRNTGGTILDAWSYQYDAVGNRTSKTNMEGKSEIYRYDNVYRLTEAHYADGTVEQYSYDSAGNRTRRTNELGDVTTYSYDIANQLLSAGSDTFNYDGNGNLIKKVTSRGTSTFTYDARNRLTNTTGPDGSESNLYDVEGRRIDLAGASLEDRQVRVIYDLAGNPILDWGTDNQTWTYRLYGPGIDEPLAEYRRYHNRKTYLHADALGSITAVTSSSGQMVYRSSYRVFGQMSRTTYDVAPTRLAFTGRELSVGGLMQYRTRHYDTSVGRFLRQDDYRGRMDSPPSLHRYTYVHNNPINYVDPMGRAAALPEGIYLGNWFWGLIALTSVLGMLTAIVADLTDNFYGVSPNTAAIVGMFGSIVGFASVWLWLEAAIGAMVMLGLSLLSSAAFFYVIFDPQSYTACEIIQAIGTTIFGMMLTFIWSIMFPTMIAGGTDSIAGAEYAFIALFNLINFGWSVFASWRFGQLVSQPFDVRYRECQRRGAW